MPDVPNENTSTVTTTWEASAEVIPGPETLARLEREREAAEQGENQ